MKFHMTDDGPKKCVASSADTCRATFSGDKSDHFTSRAEAETAYESKLEEQHGTFGRKLSHRSASESAPKNTGGDRNWYAGGVQKDGKFASMAEPQSRPDTSASDRDWYAGGIQNNGKPAVYTRKDDREGQAGLYTSERPKSDDDTSGTAEEQRRRNLKRQSTELPPISQADVDSAAYNKTRRKPATLPVPQQGNLSSQRPRGQWYNNDNSATATTPLTDAEYNAKFTRGGRL